MVELEAHVDFQQGRLSGKLKISFFCKLFECELCIWLCGGEGSLWHWWCTLQFGRKLGRTLYNGYGKFNGGDDYKRRCESGVSSIICSIGGRSFELMFLLL